ncbi:MAG: hypothetical protein ACXVA9_04760 [Bdellovibrionales bacterium]
MKKSLSLIALIVVSAVSHAKNAKMNADTTAELKALVTNCVDSRGANPGVDKAVILESLVNDICSAVKEGLSSHSKAMMSAEADISELQVLGGECIVNTVNGKFVNAPRDTKNVDLEAAAFQLASVAGDKMGGYDSPCSEKMCGTDAESLKVKLACQNFVEWDSLRRAADMIETSEYRGDSKDIAHDKALQGYKSLLEVATANLMQLRGHFQAPGR